MKFKSINSWGEFQKDLTLKSKKEKGNAFELLTKLYFKIEPIYSFYDHVWLLDEAPQKDLDYLALPSQDLGIDLIAKTNGEYHAIQCKYHSDSSKSVTFKEVSTFISLVESNEKFSKGYICSSADLTSKNFDKIKTDKIIKIMSDSWEKLDVPFFDQARNLTQGKKLSLTPFKPRLHQKKAIEEATEYFVNEDHPRGKLIFPCGAGKSLTGFWLTQSLNAKSTVVAVPSLSLVKQTLEVYLREIVANKKHVKWLCICSDEGIGRNDDVAMYTEDIGVPCVTDPEYIKNWLIENRDEDKIVFTTYQSGRIIAEVSKELDFTFDVGIFDEAHKTVGSDKKLFSHLLFDDNISIDKRIFMTATERYYAGSKDDIISMDDYDIYGNTFSQMSFKEAIELDLLTDYKVITIEVTKGEIANFIKDNNLVQLNDKWKKETEARSLASMLALRKAMKKYPIKNAVSFHSSIEKAVRNKELQEYITDSYDYSPIDTYTVSGKIPTTKRNKIVQEFASSDRALITNARCLTEGVDVPNIDCILFADPRKSRVDIVQALGRALRKKKGKESGYVVLPIVFDEETKEISDDNFSEILAIVSALASNDERIVEYLKDVNSGKPKTSRDRQFQLDVLADYLDETELTEQIQIKLWDKLAKLNWMPFEEAREYVRELGLNGQKDWKEYAKSDKKPKNIPSKPEKSYSNMGWIGYGDWLGTGNLAPKDRNYRSFEKAREYVRGLELKGHREWSECKKPNDIPSHPNEVYKNEGWINWVDWIGYGRARGVFKPFEEAREFARGLKLKSMKEWIAYCKSNILPLDIPSDPSSAYENDNWISGGDWLGTGYISTQNRVYLPFEEARTIVRGLKFKSGTEWFQYCKSGKKPVDIPATPNTTYKDKGWKGYGDWIGTFKVAKKEKVFLPYLEARKFVRKLELKNSTSWMEYRKSSEKPKNIPSNPQNTYKNKGWSDWNDWLGTIKIEKYISFEIAREKVRILKLKNKNEWDEYVKSGEKPINIPSSPHNAYRGKGWISIGDWLGTGSVATKFKEFKSYSEAKEFVRKLELENQNKWRIFSRSGKRPYDIPSNPKKTYKNKGWKGWADFLGKE